MAEVNNVRQIAAQTKMFSANKTESEARTTAEQRAEKGSLFHKKQDFKNDKQLTSNEVQVLIEEFGMTKAQIKEMQKDPQMVEFLDALLHAGDGKANADEIKAARQAVVQQYLIGNDTKIGNTGFMDELSNFGLDTSKVVGILQANQETALEQSGFRNSTVVMGIGADAAQSQFVSVIGGDEDNPEIRFYDRADIDFNGQEAVPTQDPKLVLKPADENGKYFVSADGSKTFRMNNGNLSEIQTLPTLTIGGGEGRAASLVGRYTIYTKEGEAPQLQIRDAADIEGTGQPIAVLNKDGDYYVGADGKAYTFENGQLTEAGTVRERVTLDNLDESGVEDMSARMVQEEVDGKPVIKLFKEDQIISEDGQEPAAILTQDDNGLFVYQAEDGSKAHYELVTDDNGNQVLRQAVPPKPPVREAISNAKGITIDETGSTQRFTGKKVWNTKLRVKEFTENGVPKKISIQLPSEYGTVKRADGSDTGRRLYSTVSLIDEENMIYQDAHKRKFQLIVNDDGSVTLKQIDIDNAATKASLDHATQVTADRARANGLDGKEQKVVVDTPAKAKAVISQLSNSNAAWETFTQIGTNNGMHTKWRGDGVSPAGGCFEALIGGDNGIEYYSQIEPAVMGLLKRVPPDVVGTPEYKAVQEAMAQLKALGNVSLKDTARRGHIYHNLVSNLDQKLMALAQKHIAGRVQGAGQGNNNYVIGARGKVKIYSENSRDRFMSDAIFEMGGHKFKISEYGVFGIKLRDVDFQDMFEYKYDGKRDDLSTGMGSVTGDNRYGSIVINKEKIQNLDGMKFKDQATGKKYEVKVDGGVAYVVNGSQRVNLEDILNGRANFPL